MTTTPIVRLDEVSKSYGHGERRTEVLKGVNLTILPGETASLVGPSGSGKSTLLALIAGLLRPDVGAVEIDAVAMSDLDDRARARLRADRIGIALQSENLIPFLTARENVELAMTFTTGTFTTGTSTTGAFTTGTSTTGAFTVGRRRRSARARALTLLERFGVAHRAQHRPRQLSGGEAQRVALAVSMANEPALLLADEVVAQLDGRTAARVIDEVLTADFAVLYVTHDVAIADLAESRYALTDQGVHPR